ncbi:MAG: T9SS type A sorting domain-containing protein [Bacteroidales bacterium]|nr:T9SS type A sorting domain-containing protein [Bacteroidales bacterium]
MKKNLLKTKLVILTICMLISAYSFGQKDIYSYSDSWGTEGMSMKSSKATGVDVNFSVQNFSLADKTLEKSTFKTIEISGKFLPGEEGAPDLPSYAKYVAVPNGATASLEIVNVRKEIIKNVDIAPALDIPFVGQEEATKFTKNEEVYSKNAFYPANPFQISKKSVIRGVEVVTLGISPFQYNPVTKELIVYRDIELKVNFEGGKSEFGENRLRSRWFDPILENTIMNYTSLPKADYTTKTDSKATGYEYVIVVPNDASFIAWADTIKQFRTLQGISTGIVTISDIGSNSVETIKSYFVDAYNNWDTPPVAVLIMADYGTSGVGITSKEYSHPYQGTYISDNYYADVVNSDGLPDITFARMTAQNAAQLEVMVTKFKNYELNPPTDSDFYDHPVTACGWQTERWFQLCSEIVGGYLKNELGKSPVRINEIYDGTPGSVWSTATNTSTVVNYFGPNGLDYIPASPTTLGNWSGGDATDVVNALNSGAFMLQHRDHGAYWGWGEPSFTSTNISSLTNTDLSFIFSMNCSTGQFDYTSECFAEKFHRYTYNGENAGALGLIAATQVSYSFVNDAFAWGIYDFMWPDFMPNQSALTSVDATPATLLPGFASVNGKYFLAQSNWPYNTSDKAITYNLFHLHGDAFTMLYSEVPQNLTISHAAQLAAGVTTFSVTANTGSLIAITANGEILGTAIGTGASKSITIPSQVGGNIIVTVTQQNYYRYSVTVPVTGGSTTEFALTSSIGTGAGSISPASGSYIENTSVNVTAIPASGYEFDFWSGDISGTSNPTSVVMTEDKNVVANFVALPSYLGYTDLGDQNTTTANRRAMPLVMPESGVIQSITMYHLGGSGNMILGIYEGTATVPSNRIGVTASTVVSSTTGWQTINLITPVQVLEDDNIFLAWVYETNPGIQYLTGDPGRIDAGTTWSAGMPTTWGSTATQSSFLYNIYAEYSTEIGNIPPTAVVNGPYSGQINTSVAFSSAGSTDSDGSIVSYAWTFGDGGTSTLANPSHTYTTDGTFTVTLKVTDDEAAESSVSSTTAVITDPTALTYCTTVGSNFSYEWIGSVQIGTYTNTSGAAGYTDFTSETVNVNSGTTSVTLTPAFSGSTYNEYWKIWIDLNLDGVFNDTDELVYDCGTMSTSAVTGNMSIPTSANGVTSRMRVSMKYNGAQTACETFPYGEVEDYTVSISSSEAFSDMAIDEVSIESNSFDLYPNPANKMLNIELNGYGANINVKILDINGRIIDNFIMEENHKSLDIEHFNTGIYLIVIEGENKVDSKRFIKE